MSGDRLNQDSLATMDKMSGGMAEEVGRHDQPFEDEQDNIEENGFCLLVPKDEDQSGLLLSL